MSNSSKVDISFLKGVVSPTGACQRIVIAQFAHAYDSRKLFTTLANRFTSLAEHYYVSRDFESLEEASSVLINLPLAEAQQIGLYYQSFIKYRKGQKKEAQTQIEKIAGGSLSAYQARALQTLGSFHYYQGKVDEALKLYRDASHRALSERGSNLLANLMASLNTCHIISDLGDHQRSLSKLESLWPLVRQIAQASPLCFYAYHNALAVEFSELGHIREAESAISIALSSPFASAYPEWSETREEVEQKRNYPDPSRCFLDRSIAESEATPDSDNSLSIETERQAQQTAAPQYQSTVAAKPLRAFAFHRFITSLTCQITLTLPNASLFIPGGSAKSFLQRLGRSVQLRGPPTSLLF
jgi:tetratricopeptide (TPR) repeat protein